MERLFLSALVLLLFTLPLRAQTPDTSTMQGEVADSSGARVPEVTVSVVNQLSGLARTVKTDASGRFFIPGLPAGGEYNLVLDKAGFASTHLDNLGLTGGATVDLSLMLSVAAVRTQTSVTGVAGAVRSDEPQLGDRLSTAQMDEMPLPNRRITYLPLLNAANRPAINQGDVFMNEELFTTNGAGRRQTSFVVDGGTGNDSWGRQTIFTNLPLAAVEQMTVLENAFSSEYGASTGSVINIVTRSGGNHFHGEGLGLWRPSAPEAKLSGFNSTTATSGNDLADDTLVQGAAALSGPMSLSGKTQFFAAGEYSSQDRASPVTSPIAPGNFVGRYRGYLGFLRVDHQIDDRNNIFFHSGADSFRDTNPNGTVGGQTLPSVDRIFRRRTFTQELGTTDVLSPRLLNNVRLQFQLASPITQFDPVIYGAQFEVPVSAGGVFTSGTSQSALLMNHQYAINDTLSADWGRNQVRFGGEMIHAHSGGDSKEYGGPIYLGQFIYKTCTDSLTVCESSSYLDDILNVQSYTQSYGNAEYNVDDTLWSVFVQDDYRVRQDVTINLGLRYEQQTFTDARRDFAPRVGFAYDLHRNGKTVVRSGFGIYNSQIVDNSEANYALTGPTGVFNYTAMPGQVGFPVSISQAPMPAFPAGALKPLLSLYIRPGRSTYLNQFFQTSTLKNYPDKLLNPYSEQWTFGVEQQLAPQWVLSVDYVGSHTLRNVRPLDVDPPASFIRTTQGQTRTAQAANCTRPYWIEWYNQHDLTCNPAAASSSEPPYSVIQSDVNDGYAYYDALDLNVSHRFSQGSSMLASYTWSHAIDNVDPDIPSQNPNDPNFTGHAESGSAIFDQRHRFVLSGTSMLPLKIEAGGIATLGSGLPYNVVTGTTNSGDTGATTDRPVVNGQVIGRNTGRGNRIYDVAPFLERTFPLPLEQAQVTVRAEAFNALNHANFAGYSGTYGNGTAPGNGFGEPLTGITNQLPARSLQFSAKVTF